MAEAGEKETHEQFEKRFSTLVIHGFVSLSTSLGIQSGLFEALIKLKDEERTVKEIADTAGLKERYTGLIQYKFSLSFASISFARTHAIPKNEALLPNMKCIFAWHNINCKKWNLLNNKCIQNISEYMFFQKYIVNDLYRICKQSPLFLHLRYVKEWLGVMVAADIVDINPETEKYSLPLHRIPFFQPGSSVSDLGVLLTELPTFGGVYKKLLDCLKKDGPQGKYILLGKSIVKWNLYIVTSQGRQEIWYIYFF